MPSLRNRSPKPSVPAFQPLPLVNVLMSLIGRRKRKTSRPPINPDWEREEPMTGLS